MSGHNKWSQIKNQKGAADKKRGQLFSKLLKAISIAAKTEANPQFNPRLRSAIEKAKGFNVPQDNIERAVSKASEAKDLEDVIIEAYGPEGSAIIIEGITDNSNRTVSEIKHLLNENNAKIANPGSVLWAFAQSADERGLNAEPRGNWKPKFPQSISESGKNQLTALIDLLEEREDVQCVITNMN